MNEYPKCKQCHRIVDAALDRYDDELCVICSRPEDPSIPPWPDHMMLTIEPHIQWRINQVLQEVAMQYLKSSSTNKVSSNFD